MIKPIDVIDLDAYTWPIVDVRSPNEFDQDHILGAINLPLLNNEQRHLIGITYKEKGKAEAIALGHQLIDPQKQAILDQAKRLIKGQNIRLYCARGGLRSHKMAEFLSQNGYSVYLIKGGYKQFRNRVFSRLEAFKNIVVLSAYTGSGKTQILNLMQKKGAQVLDLETLAHHKGSAFGHLGMPTQESSAQFHNAIYEALKPYDPNQLLWVENESFIIGKVHMPATLWENMKSAKVLEIEIPTEARVKLIIEAYGKFPKLQLVERVQKLSKRLGNENTTLISAHIEADQLASAVPLLLKYYDKAYDLGRLKRQQSSCVQVSFDAFDLEAIAEQLLNMPL